MGSAAGTRNIISFSSDRYKDEPLVVSGPGAGPSVTAAGILNDICELALTVKLRYRAIRFKSSRLRRALT